MSDITTPEVKSSDCQTVRDALRCLGSASGHTTASAIRKTFRAPKVLKNKIHDVRISHAMKVVEKSEPEGIELAS